jgi:hypothetical protein
MRALRATGERLQVALLAGLLSCALLMGAV